MKNKKTKKHSGKIGDFDNNITVAQAIGLLKKYSTSEEAFNKVYSHSKTVQKIALRFAKGTGADLDFIRTASLLHDIGRFQCPPGKQTIFHGLIGSEILQKENLPKHALVCERHLGAGISKQDIINQKLPLPKKDYLPLSMEEKIITDADSLTFGTREGTIQEVIDRYRREINDEIANRAKQMHDEVLKMKKS